MFTVTLRTSFEFELTEVEMPSNVINFDYNKASISHSCCNCYNQYLFDKHGIIPSVVFN